MDKEKIKSKRIPREYLKVVRMSLSITPEQSKWLKENNYSPNSILEEAINDLGFSSKRTKEKITKK